MVWFKLQQSKRCNVFYIHQPSVCFFNLFELIYLSLLFQCLAGMKISFFL